MNQYAKEKSNLYSEHAKNKKNSEQIYNSNIKDKDEELFEQLLKLQ